MHMIIGDYNTYTSSYVQCRIIKQFSNIWINSATPVINSLSVVSGQQTTWSVAYLPCKHAPSGPIQAICGHCGLDEPWPGLNGPSISLPKQGQQLWAHRGLTTGNPLVLAASNEPSVGQPVWAHSKFCAMGPCRFCVGIPHNPLPLPPCAVMFKAGVALTPSESDLQIYEPNTVDYSPFDSKGGYFFVILTLFQF